MKNIDQKAAHLIEGSVWQNKHGKTYTVLFVSNVTVNRKLAERFIPSVTFINSDGAVFTLDCDSFLRAYHWVEDNSMMVTCIEQVYKCNAGELDYVDPNEFVNELEQEVGTEEPEVEDTHDSEQLNDVVEQQGPTLAEQLVKPFIVDFVTEGNPALSKQELAQAFEGYSSYMDSRGVMFHKLLFSVRDNVIAYTLNQTFNPSVYKDEQNGYDSIHLNTGHVDFDIMWNAFGYVGAEVINGCEYLVVVLANEPQEMLDTMTVEEVQPEEEQVQQETPEVVQSTEDAPTEVVEPTVTVEAESEQPEEQPQEQVQEQVVEPTESDEPKVIAHLASPLDGIQVIHSGVHVAQPEEPQEVEQPIEINVDDVQVERPKSADEQAMDNYFSVVDITDSQVQQVADEVTKA
jgi:hypothetical protein